MLLGIVIQEREEDGRYGLKLFNVPMELTRGSVSDSEEV